MDAFELNKIAGAVLGSILLVLSLGFIGDFFFHTEKPETPAFAVEVADAAGGGGEKKADAANEVSFADLLASADVKAGEKVTKKCKSCHAFEKDGKNKVGPVLFGVVDRALGSYAGFAYSAAMKAKAGEVSGWDTEALNAFLKKPKDYLPKTSMSFGGLKKAKDRANLIAYLKSLAE